MMRTLRIGLALTMVLGRSVSAADWPQWRNPATAWGTRKISPPLDGHRTSRGRSIWQGRRVIADRGELDRIFVTSQIGTGISRQTAAGASGRSASERALSAARRQPQTGLSP
jgi:hypothetical protein